MAGLHTNGIFVSYGYKGDEITPVKFYKPTNEPESLERGVIALANGSNYKKMDAEYIPETLLAKIEADINKDIERREKFRHTDSGDFDDSEPFVYTPKKFGPLAESKLDKYIKLLEKQTGKKVMLESNEEAFKKRLAAGIKQGGFDVTEILALTDLSEENIVYTLQNVLDSYLTRKGWGFEAQMDFIQNIIRDAVKDTGYQLNESSRHRLTYSVNTIYPQETLKALSKYIDIKGIKPVNHNQHAMHTNSGKKLIYNLEFMANEDLERILGNSPFDKLINRYSTADAALLGNNKADIEDFKSEEYPSMGMLEDYIDFVEEPLKSALLAPRTVSDFKLIDEFEDDHEECYNVEFKLNGVPCKMSLMWISNPRWIYQMEDGKPEALKKLVNYIKSHDLKSAQAKFNESHACECGGSCCTDKK